MISVHVSRALHPGNGSESDHRTAGLRNTLRLRVRSDLYVSIYVNKDNNVVRSMRNERRVDAYSKFTRAVGPMINLDLDRCVKFFFLSETSFLDR